MCVKITRIFSSSPRLAVCCFSSRSLSWEQICRNQTRDGRSHIVFCHYDITACQLYRGKMGVFSAIWICASPEHPPPFVMVSNLVSLAESRVQLSPAGINGSTRMCILTNLILFFFYTYDTQPQTPRETHMHTHSQRNRAIDGT